MCCCYCTTTDFTLCGPLLVDPVDPYFADFYEPDKIEAQFENDCAEITGENLFSSLEQLDDSRIKLLHGDIEYESRNGNYNVLLDLHQLHVKEIAIKFHGGIITVEGWHKIKHSLSPKSFTRIYRPSTEFDLDQAECSVSSDGVFLITAPKVIIPPSKNDGNKGTGVDCCLVGLWKRIKSWLQISTTRVKISNKPVIVEKQKQCDMYTSKAKPVDDGAEVPITVTTEDNMVYEYGQNSKVFHGESQSQD